MTEDAVAEVGTLDEAESFFGPALVREGLADRELEDNVGVMGRSGRRLKGLWDGGLP